MKNIDKLVLRSFVGPFLLTFVVVVFIFLTQFMMKYVDDLVGKDLGIDVIAQLLFYFSLNMMPVSLPLAILLSSLMTFGNLGEHYELTAIKSSGISLLRTLRPVFFAVLGLSVVSFLFSNYVVTRTNLKAYSLLYDVKRKKPTLEFKEGMFYSNIPQYSIRITEKEGEDGLRGVMIYDHTPRRGNTDVILADSGRMYTAHNDRYLVMELYRGERYSEQAGSHPGDNVKFTRTAFDRSKLLFSLSSFDMSRTQEELFSGNRVMRNVAELRVDVDSLRRVRENIEANIQRNVRSYYAYHRSANHTQPDHKASDTSANADADSALQAPPDSQTTRQNLLAAYRRKKQAADTLVAGEVSRALNQARSVRSFTQSYAERVRDIQRNENKYAAQMHLKFTQSMACIVLFMIGAPLGAIIKKGGLGVPILISVIFFIVYYVLTIIGEKWAKEGVVEVPYGMWTPNLILAGIGLFFLGKARNDSSLLDADYYLVTFRRLFERLRKRWKKAPATS